MEALTIAFALNCGRLRIHDAKVIYEDVCTRIESTRVVGAFWTDNHKRCFDY